MTQDENLCKETAKALIGYYSWHLDELLELYNAMGFPPDYIIDRDYMGNPYPKNEQVARWGNAVCPPMAAAVARANFPEYVAKVGDTITTMAALLDMVAV